MRISAPHGGQRNGRGRVRGPVPARNRLREARGCKAKLRTKTPGGAIEVGASTFIWVSPFSNKTPDLIDLVKAFCFDLIEICVGDLSPASGGTALSRSNRKRGASS